MPIGPDAGAAAAGAAGALWAALPGFLLGYALLLVAPGPNLLAMGCVVALRGLRGALPACLGVALGAGALALGLLLALGGGEAAARPPGLAEGLRAAAAALLLGIAATVLRGGAARAAGAPPPGRARAGRWRAVPRGLASFLACFSTAATNPLTAAYFTAQFLGPMGAAAPGGGVPAALVLPAVVAAAALGFWTGAAALLAHPAAQRSVRAWDRPIRAVASAALALSALAMLRPVLAAAAAAP